MQNALHHNILIAKTLYHTRYIIARLYALNIRQLVTSGPISAGRKCFVINPFKWRNLAYTKHFALTCEVKTLPFGSVERPLNRLGGEPPLSSTT